MEKKKFLEDLPNQNHEFLEGKYPYTINPGGPNHEELVSIIGIYEYLENVYKIILTINLLQIKYLE